MISVKGNIHRLRLYIRCMGMGLLLMATSVLYAQDLKVIAKPDPPTLVNDLAKILSADESQALEQKLRNYNDSTSTQIVVVTLPSLEGNDIAQYATELGQQWGIGQKGKDNGIVFLIAPSEHKLFIAAGRGVESTLPDAYCKRIIEQVVKPAFKQGNYAQGINNGVDAMGLLLAGTYQIDGVMQRFGGDDSTVTNRPTRRISWKIVLLIIFIIIILSSSNRGNGGYLYSSGGGMLIGGLLGGGGGGFGGGGSSGGGFGGGGFGGGGAGGSW